jgi:hypothetical protein
MLDDAWYTEELTLLGEDTGRFLYTTVKKGTLGQSKTYTVKFMKRDPANLYAFIDL